MRITEELLNNLFKEEGLRFTHDDEMRPNANYYWVSSDSYPGVCLRVYAGAERGGNLVNRYSVNDQYVSGILCLDTNVFNVFDEEFEVVGLCLDTDDDDLELELYEEFLMRDEMFEDHGKKFLEYLYFNGTPCVAYVDQENVTDYGYLNFADDIASIRNVADLMFRQLADAVA